MENENLTVLLVDDEEPVRETTEAMLEVLGYNVETAPNGIEALEIYNKKKDVIDVVLLDMSMPKMSGKETLIKLLEINPSIKVIISSEYDIDGPVKELLEIGATTAFQKPFRMQELKKLLSDVLDA